MSKKPLRALFALGSLLMVSGVIAAGLTYREMRAQRLLHEPQRIFKLRPGQSSQWQSAPLAIYQNGSHAVFLSISEPGNITGKTSDRSHVAPYRGGIETVVTNPQGEVVMNARCEAFSGAIVKPDRLMWFPIDTLRVANASTGNWTIQTRLTSGDATFSGSLAELVVIPPHPEQFTPYLESASRKLYGSGIAVVAGFFVFFLGGRLTH